jgi:L-alanine-DL-glutamate epimerase-like enolase superfamily enzyme
MIRSIEVIPLRLPIAKALTLSRGVAASPGEGAPHILVRVTNDEGVVGWGEARPSPRWSYETPESVVTTIRHYLAPALLHQDESDVAGLHALMDAVIAPGVQLGQPIAKSAIDLAVHDLLGKKLGLPLAALLGRSDKTPVRLCYVVSASTVEEAVRQTEEGVRKGYHGFKVKTGIHPEHDLAMVQAIVRVARGRTIWVDANQGWDLNTAVRLAGRMADLGVAVLEQPLAANNILGYRDLARRSDVPVVLDESLYTPRDLIQFVRFEAVHGVVIKLCRVGGIFWARQIAETALAADLLLLGSGLTEGRISLNASAHLFSSFGITMPVDLNGPQFLKDDMVAGQFMYPDQVVTLSDRPGIGVEPDPEKIERYRVPEPTQGGT